MNKVLKEIENNQNNIDILIKYNEIHVIIFPNSQYRNDQLE